MKTRDRITADKLRGGFYTPDPLIDLCLSRIERLIQNRSDLAVLEPSAGDGAFIRGLGRSPLGEAISSLTAIEVSAPEAAKCDASLERTGLEGRVLCESSVGWAAATSDEFDVAAGNPPFVRFQFVGDDDREDSAILADRMGISFAGVSNLWLPVLLGALGRLRVGGAFGFVVPAECFTGISAAALREWLVRNATKLQFDLFPPRSFPGVLQEVVVLSGQRSARGCGPTTCTIVEHGLTGTSSSTEHTIDSGQVPWTRYLLRRDELEAYNYARSLPAASALGRVARFEVAAVTGANNFFSVDEATLSQYALERWGLPLLPRIRHAPGLTYTSHDHEAARTAGARVHLLDFAASREDPMAHPRPAEYIASGVEEELHKRYKCRIREPWYRVPFIRAGGLMLSKRSHEYPRVVVNEVGAVTTDTIYRGTLLESAPISARDLAAAFHNSLTLLSAEVEGRSFGGGVLELVPSEVARLTVPLIPRFGEELARLDSLARHAVDGQHLVDETDLLLVKADIGVDEDLIDALAAGRRRLMHRRLDRNANS